MIWADMTGSNQIFGYVWDDHVWIWTVRLTARLHQISLGQQMNTSGLNISRAAGAQDGPLAVLNMF